jgi:hypothetical protein
MFTGIRYLRISRRCDLLTARHMPRASPNSFCAKAKCEAKISIRPV